MSINDDQQIIQKGRKNTLKDEPGVEARIVDRSPKALFNKLTKENYGIDVQKLWHQGNAERAEWLSRQEAFLQQYDEFLDPIIEAPADWASDLHLPIGLTIAKAFHARFYAAVMGQDPICNVKARQEANIDRVPVIQDLMQYSLKDWANDYQGIEAEVDKYIWNWSVRGVAIQKSSWEKRLSRIIDVVKKNVPTVQYVVDPASGEEVAVEAVKQVEVEEEVIITDCDAPVWKRIAPEDFVMVGGEGDPDKADAVLEQAFLTASDLWLLVDQGIFNESAVEKVIKGGEDNKSASVPSGIKTLQAEKAGEGSLDKSYDLDRYQIVECYSKKDVDGSGINTEIVTWVHLQSGTILKATYLNRINRQTKKRPYAKSDLYIREGQTYGVGWIELTYSICAEIDALNNMSLDFGILSSMPFGYYKASSAISQSYIPIEPGALIPVDDPSSILFPNMGNRAGFSMQYLQFLYSILERLTGINDLALGVIGAQGVTRTASGVAALQSESNTNLDIFLRRLNRGLKKSFEYTFALVQDNMPEGFEFRVLGDDGKEYFRKVKDRNEIAGKYDFSLEPNSSNSNASVRLNAATQVMQLTSNPLDLQLGIVTTLNRYEALKGYLIALGVKDYNKFIQKPQGAVRVFTPEELANRVLQGINVQLDPTQDLQGFIAWVDNAMSDEQISGQFNTQMVANLIAKKEEAAGLLQAMEQMAAQQANAQQMRQNAAQSMQQTSQQAIPSTQSSQPMNGGGAMFE